MKRQISRLNRLLCSILIIQFLLGCSARSPISQTVMEPIAASTSVAQNELAPVEVSQNTFVLFGAVY